MPHTGEKNGVKVIRLCKEGSQFGTRAAKQKKKRKKISNQIYESVIIKGTHSATKKQQRQNGVKPDFG